MGDLHGRYARYTKRLVETAFGALGHTPAALRDAIAARAATLGGRPAQPSRGAPAGGVPGPLSAYADTVARHAYQVTDADVAALKQLGHSDDVLFEVTVAAALGAGLGRLERGLAVLRGGERD